MKSNLLTFCIPTFNRSEILKEGLIDLISKIAEYKFEIIVVDNCSTDDTAEVVNELKKRYAYLTYFKNDQNCGPDENFAISLKKSQSTYAWLLGDSYRILDQELPILLSILYEKVYDLVLVNSFDMINNIDNKEYDNTDLLIKELGWYLPQMSAYIYKKSFLIDADYEKFFNSNFVQMGIVFDKFRIGQTKVYWYKENSVFNTARKKNSWHNEFLQVFGKNWVEFVMSLPREISLETKLQCIRKHGEKHKLFSIVNLLNYREKGWLTSKVLIKYKPFLPFISMPPFWISYLISILPKKLLSLPKVLFYK